MLTIVLSIIRNLLTISEIAEQFQWEGRILIITIDIDHPAEMTILQFIQHDCECHLTSLIGRDRLLCIVCLETAAIQLHIIDD